MERIGLRQVTDSASPAVVAFDGKVAAFQFSEGPLGEPRDVLIGYSFETETLFPIAVSDVYHATRIRLDDGRVVFSQEPRAGAPDQGDWTYLAFWEKGEDWKKVETRLDGEHIVHGFDWPWVTFTVRGTPGGTQDGMWAMNLETRFKLPLGPHPLNRTSPELVTSSTVGDGWAYYNVRNVTTDKYRVEERHLPDGPVRVLRNDNDLAYDFDASDRYVTWIANGPSSTAASVYDRTTGNITYITERPIEGVSQVRVGGDWVVYRVHPSDAGYRSRLEGYHIPTGTRHLLIGAPQEDGEGLVQESDTDGRRVLVSFTPFHEDYPQRGKTNAYWMELPDVEK